MANVGPTKWYCDFGNGTNTGYFAVAAWSTPLTPAAGSLIRQAAAPSVGNERVFVCIVSGAVGGAEPAWTVTKGGKTTDNAATWQECTGQPGVNGDTVNSPTWLQNKNTTVTIGLIIFDSVTSSLQIVSTAGTTGNGAAPGFSATAGTTTGDNTVTWTSLGLASTFGAWAAPFARLNSPGVTNWNTAGNTNFVASEHVETVSGSYNIADQGSLAAPTLWISVTKTAVPPTDANYLAGASLTDSNGNISLPSAGSGAKFQGISFSTGGSNITGASNTNSFLHVKDATLSLTAAGAATINIVNNSDTLNLFENVTVSFSNAAQNISGGGTGGAFEWRGGTVTGTIPNSLFNLPANGTSILVHGVDLSLLTAGKSLVALNNAAPGYPVLFSDCKLGAGVATTTGSYTGPSQSIVLINCDSGATGYRNEWHGYFGDITTETTITLKNGGSDGVQSISHKYVTSANASPNTPLTWPPAEKRFGVWNTTTGKSVAASVQIISSGTLNNNDIWMENEYLASAASPKSSFVNDGLSNPLATAAAQPSSTSSWNSQPATPVTQQLQNTLTPNLVGYVYGRIFVGKPSTTVYVDPELTLK